MVRLYVDDKRRIGTWTRSAAAMDPAVRLQLLQQLGEQSRAFAIATMHTKAVIMAALLVLALSELWLGVTRWRAERCQSYE